MAIAVAIVIGALLLTSAGRKFLGWSIGLTAFVAVGAFLALVVAAAVGVIE